MAGTGERAGAAAAAEEESDVVLFATPSKAQRPSSSSSAAGAASASAGKGDDACMTRRQLAEEGIVRSPHAALASPPHLNENNEVFSLMAAGAIEADGSRRKVPEQAQRQSAEEVEEEDEVEVLSPQELGDTGGRVETAVNSSGRSMAAEEVEEEESIFMTPPPPSTGTGHGFASSIRGEARTVLEEGDCEEEADEEEEEEKTEGVGEEVEEKPAGGTLTDRLQPRPEAAHVVDEVIERKHDGHSPGDVSGVVATSLRSSDTNGVDNSNSLRESGLVLAASAVRSTGSSQRPFSPDSAKAAPNVPVHAHATASSSVESVTSSSLMASAQSKSNSAKPASRSEDKQWHRHGATSGVGAGEQCSRKAALTVSSSASTSTSTSTSATRSSFAASVSSASSSLQELPKLLQAKEAEAGSRAVSASGLLPSKLRQPTAVDVLAKSTIQDSNSKNMSTEQGNMSGIRRSDLGDEWKEAITPAGKRYFYNRRTRESAWKVPANAVFVQTTPECYRIFEMNRQHDVDLDLSVDQGERTTQPGNMKRNKGGSSKNAVDQDSFDAAPAKGPSSKTTNSSSSSISGDDSSRRNRHRARGSKGEGGERARDSRTPATAILAAAATAEADTDRSDSNASGEEEAKPHPSQLHKLKQRKLAKKRFLESSLSSQKQHSAATDDSDDARASEQAQGPGTILGEPVVLSASSSLQQQQQQQQHQQQHISQSATSVRSSFSSPERARATSQVGDTLDPRDGELDADSSFLQHTPSRRLFVADDSPMVNARGHESDGAQAAAAQRARVRREMDRLPTVISFSDDDARSASTPGRRSVSSSAASPARRGRRTETPPRSASSRRQNSASQRRSVQRDADRIRSADKRVIGFCPVCGESLPATLLDTHVADCVARAPTHQAITQIANALVASGILQRATSTDGAASAVAAAVSTSTTAPLTVSLDGSQSLSSTRAQPDRTVAGAAATATVAVASGQGDSSSANTGMAAAEDHTREEEAMPSERNEDDTQSRPCVPRRSRSTSQSRSRSRSGSRSARSSAEEPTGAEDATSRHVVGVTPKQEDVLRNYRETHAQLGTEVPIVEDAVFPTAVEGDREHGKDTGGRPFARSRHRAYEQKQLLTDVEVCEDCGRSFARGRLESHRKVCKSVFREKRPVFNAKDRRIRGTPLETFVPPVKTRALSAGRQRRSGTAGVQDGRRTTGPHTARARLYSHARGAHADGSVSSPGEVRARLSRQEREREQEQEQELEGESYETPPASVPARAHRTTGSARGNGASRRTDRRYNSSLEERQRRSTGSRSGQTPRSASGFGRTLDSSTVGPATTSDMADARTKYRSHWRGSPRPLGPDGFRESESEDAYGSEQEQRQRQREGKPGIMRAKSAPRLRQGKEVLEEDHDPTDKYQTQDTLGSCGPSGAESECAREGEEGSGGQEAVANCPFCGHVRSRRTLSSHLLQCQELRRMRSRRAEAATKQNAPPEPGRRHTNPTGRTSR